MAQPNTPNWMRPLWVRVLLCVLPAAWAGVELYTGNPFWAVISGAAGLYLAFELFVRRKPD